MHKICHVTSAHNRYDVRIFEKECTSLAKMGYDVYLIVNDNLPDEEKNGVHFVSTGFFPRNRKDRMLNSMKYIWRKVAEIDAECYHLHDPELLQIASKIAKNGKKVIFDAHEDTVEQIMDKDWIPLPFRKVVSGVYKLYQKNKFSKCTALITVTPTILAKLMKMNKNSHMVTNYPIISESTDSSILEKKSNYVFFAGGISAQWCHTRIIKAVARIDEITYRLAGPIESEYENLIRNTEGWESVDYLGRIPHSQVESEYKGALAGMAVNECTQIKGEGTLGNTKLFEVMAAGIPVICSDYRLWKEIVEKFECGICVDSRSVDDIVNAIQYIHDNPENAKKMGENGRRAIEDVYNWKTQEKVLEKVYGDIFEV